MSCDASWLAVAPASDLRCNFATLDASSLAADALADAIGRTNMPLLIRGLDSLRNTLAAWQDRAEFLSQHGDEVVRVGSGVSLGISGPENGLPGSSFLRSRGHVDPSPPPRTLHQVAEAMRADGWSEDDYVFYNVSRPDRSLPTLLEPLWRQAMRARDGPFATPGDAVERLALGPNGSGLVFHQHELALNALAAGAKRWFVFEHKNAAYLLRAKNGRPYAMRDWLAIHYPREATQKVWEQHGWECTQRVGEVVAVPKGLMHGVVNIGEALAVAITQV